MSRTTDGYRQFRPKSNVNPGGHSYNFPDSQCDRPPCKGIRCLECPLPKCLYDDEVVRIRHAMLNLVY